MDVIFMVYIVHQAESSSEFYIIMANVLHLTVCQFWNLLITGWNTVVQSGFIFSYGWLEFQFIYVFKYNYLEFH